MSKRRFVILATKYSGTPEANEVFAQRGWIRVFDESKPLPGVKLVRKDKHSTSLIDLILEEYEYGV